VQKNIRSTDFHVAFEKKKLYCLVGSFVNRYSYVTIQRNRALVLVHVLANLHNIAKSDISYLLFFVVNLMYSLKL